MFQKITDLAAVAPDLDRRQTLANRADKFPHQSPRHVRRSGMEVVIFPVHRGGNQISAIELELVAIGTNTGIEQAFGKGVGIDATMDGTVQEFVFRERRRAAGVSAGGPDGNQLGAGKVRAPSLQHVGMDEVVDEELLGRMPSGEIARSLVAGQVDDDSGIRVGGKDHLHLCPHR